MVLDYLLKLKESYIEKQLELSEGLIKLDIQIQENEKLMKIMESSEEFMLNSSTQSFENNVNKKYIEELNGQKINLLEEHREINQKLEFLQKEIDLLEDVITEAKLEKKYYNEIQKQEKGKTDIFQNLLENDFYEKKKISNFLNTSVLQEMQTIFDKMKFAVQLYDLDKERCKLELSHTLSMSDVIIENLKDYITEIYCEQENVNLSQALKTEFKNFKKNSHVKIHYFVDEGFQQITAMYIWYTIYLVKQLCNCTKEIFYVKKFSINVKRTSDGISIKMEAANQNAKIETIKNLIHTPNSILFDIHKKVCLLSGNLEIACDEKNIIIDLKYPIS